MSLALVSIRRSVSVMQRRPVERARQYPHVLDGAAFQHPTEVNLALAVVLRAERRPRCHHCARLRPSPKAASTLARAEFYRRQIGRAQGADIVQDGNDDEGNRVRWSSREITPGSFVLGAASARRMAAQVGHSQAEFHARRVKNQAHLFNPLLTAIRNYDERDCSMSPAGMGARP